MIAAKSMKNKVYRGYEIEPAKGGGYVWTDERGFIHYFVEMTKTPYRSEDDAIDDIDRYKRNLRSAGGR